MLKPHIILNSGLPERHDFGVSVLVDYRGEFATKLNSKTGRIILVRPDAHVAFDLASLEPRLLVEQLKRWKV